MNHVVWKNTMSNDLDWFKLCESITFEHRMNMQVMIASIYELINLNLVDVKTADRILSEYFDIIWAKIDP